MTHFVKPRLELESALVLDLLTSALLLVPHGFPTREGGVSTGTFASLNAGGGVGDAPEAVALNYDLLAAEARVPRDRLYGVTQVHGDGVVEAPATPETPADAIWSGRKGDAVGVKTADCVPVLIVDPVGRRVAAVHAGWKGTFAEIAARTVEVLVRAGSKPADLRAAIGPAIGPCCYHVGAELFSQFATRFPQQIFRGTTLDLPLAVQLTLQKAGVPAAQIDLLRVCTSCDRRFFSHRRDQGKTGRHFSFVSCLF